MKGIKREAKTEMGSPKGMGGWDDGGQKMWEAQAELGAEKICETQKVWEAQKVWDALVEVEVKQIWETQTEVEIKKVWDAQIEMVSLKKLWKVKKIHEA